MITKDNLDKSVEFVRHSHGATCKCDDLREVIFFSKEIVSLVTREVIEIGLEPKNIPGSLLFMLIIGIQIGIKLKEIEDENNVCVQ